jgi:nucleoside permease NupC
MIFTPFAYLMGADWNDATKVGELIGIKILINEFVAYTELKALEGIISVSAILIIFHSALVFSTSRFNLNNR